MTRCDQPVYRVDVVGVAHGLAVDLGHDAHLAALRHVQEEVVLGEGLRWGNKKSILLDGPTGFDARIQCRIAMAILDEIL